MSYTNNPYCTTADVKMHLDPNLGNGDDTFIGNLIIFAQTDIDREIGYPFQLDGTIGSPTVRLFDGSGQQRQQIDDLISLVQVLEIQKNTVLSSQGLWTSGTTLTTDITADVVLKPNNTFPKYYMRRNSGLDFEEGLQNYSVSGVWGFPIQAGQIYAGIPADITRATIRLAIHYYKMRDTNYADMTQEQGGIRERYTKNMPVDVVEIIKRYKRSIFLMDDR